MWIIPELTETKNISHVRISPYLKEKSIEFKGMNIKGSTIAQVESNIPLCSTKISVSLCKTTYYPYLVYFFLTLCK